MTTMVLRYRCDLCLITYSLEGSAKWCEAACEAHAIEAAIAGETTEIGSTEGESAVLEEDAPK